MRALGIILLFILIAGCAKSQPYPTAPPTETLITTPPPTTTPAPTTVPPVKTTPPPLENVAEGRALFEKTCDECHTINYPATRGGRSYMAWVGTVNDMIGNGASITDEDAELIAKYLANTYGPE